MNKKGFTLIELLATVVILSIVVMITTPNVMNLVDNSKKTLFIDDVREFSSKAIYLYSQEQYKNDKKYFENENGIYKIYLKNIDSLKEKKDAYGNKYNFDNSYITFSEPLNEDGLNEREVKVYIESCDDNEKCRYICNENIYDIDVNSIKTSCN